MKVDIKIRVTLIWCFILLTTACCKSRNKANEIKLTKENSAVISATTNNELFFISEKVLPSDLEQKITEFCEVRKLKDRNIYLEAEAATKYGAIVSVLSAIRDNNINHVHFIVGKDKDGNASQTIEAEISAELPPPERFYSASPLSPDQFFITLKSDSAMHQRIEMNKIPMSIAELNKFLENAYKYRLNKSLCVGATADQSYGDVLELMKNFEDLGVKPIILRLEYLDGNIPSHHSYS
jgi:biopolymer transport protein ExbD